MQCVSCLLNSDHPFGIFFDEQGKCSGCNAFESRQTILPTWSSEQSIERLNKELAEKFKLGSGSVLVPFDPDGETWFVLDCLLKIGIRPVVVYFNPQYADQKFFEILAACQENFDCDFLGFSLPQELIRWCIAEELAGGIAHARKLEIYGRHVSTLFVADKFGISNIVSGPHQQSEIVGNHGHYVPNQLKFPAFVKLAVGQDLLAHVQKAIENNGSEFSRSFSQSFVRKMLNRTNWHFLSDYIFWDSEEINDYYGRNFSISARSVAGYAKCWQSSSSGLKLEFFDLMRLMMIGTSKIESYLSRDIRFGRMNKAEANMIKKHYFNKSWQLRGFADFMGIDVEALAHNLRIMKKTRHLKYFPDHFDYETESQHLSHSQILYPRQ